MTPIWVPTPLSTKKYQQKPKSVQYSSSSSILGIPYNLGRETASGHSKNKGISIGFKIQGKRKLRDRTHKNTKRVNSLPQNGKLDRRQVPREDGLFSLYLI